MTEKELKKSQFYKLLKIIPKRYGIASSKVLVNCFGRIEISVGDKPFTAIPANLVDNLIDEGKL